MISFNFTLLDRDAENLFSIIQNQINKNNLDIQEAMVNNDTALIAALHEDNRYIERLKNKMLNTRIHEMEFPIPPH